jgi:hypothetical protein
MPPIDSTELAYGIPLIVVIPAVVQIAKANGLPPRLAGPAAIVTATLLIALGDLALGTSAAPLGQRLAGWLIAGIVYGLAAAGFYSLTPAGTGAILRNGQSAGHSQFRSDA